jgi:hypothetical protein
MMPGSTAMSGGQISFKDRVRLANLEYIFDQPQYIDHTFGGTVIAQGR